ncbi:MAG: transporter [Eubacterium sp.]|jgi:MFS family permease|nr:transporter [Eubacterium sp.]
MASENIGIADNKSIGYKDVLKQKEYMKLILANIINRFGDSIDAVAFTWLVYSLTNSAGWSAVIFGMNKVPTIFLQPFAGAMVENWNKKFVMVLTDIIRGICVSLIAVLFILDLLNPWVLLAATIAISSAEAFRNPAGTAILPKILDKSCYEFGISLNASLSNVVELIGLASVGAIIAFLGTQTAILIDALTFGASALIIFFIHIEGVKKEKIKLNVKDYLDTLKGGLIYVKKKKVILNFVLLAMVANAMLVPLNALQAPLVKDVLKQGEYMLSVLGFSLVLGLGIGSAFYPFVCKRLKTRTIVFLGGISISFYYMLLVLCGYLSNQHILIYIISFASSLITGIALSLLTSALNVQFMKQVETDYLARVGAILSAGCVGAMPLASFAVSVLTEIISISQIFYVISGLGIIFFLFVYFRKVRFE